MIALIRYEVGLRAFCCSVSILSEEQNCTSTFSYRAVKAYVVWRE